MLIPIAWHNLAWLLISVPSDPWFDPARGLALAREAVANQPHEWANLNTLGVAAYRAGDWKTAKETLERSITFTGGAAHDLFFLAMLSWQQGNKQQAKTLYDRAVAWTYLACFRQPRAHAVPRRSRSPARSTVQ